MENFDLYGTLADARGAACVFRLVGSTTGPDFSVTLTLGLYRGQVWSATELLSDVAESVAGFGLQEEEVHSWLQSHFQEGSVSLDEEHGQPIVSVPHRVGGYDITLRLPTKGGMSALPDKKAAKHLNDLLLRVFKETAQLRVDRTAAIVQAGVASPAGQQHTPRKDASEGEKTPEKVARTDKMASPQSHTPSPTKPQHNHRNQPAEQGSQDVAKSPPLSIGKARVVHGWGRGMRGKSKGESMFGFSQR